MTTVGPPLHRNHCVLIAHPSPDVYGADLQMLETVRALTAAGTRVNVALPADGPLVAKLLEAGAAVGFIGFPVLRRSSLSPAGMVQLAAAVTFAMPRLRRLITDVHPDVVIVNTVTLPWWLLAGRLARVPVIGHLHEAESADGLLIRKALSAPLLLATKVIANSAFTRSVLVEAVPRLSHRTQIIYNGVRGPSHDVAVADRPTPHRLLVIGRLSPRKAPHLAMEATAELRKRGLDVHLEVAGSTFAGYEWYEEQLRTRAANDDLAGHVTFTGYRSPVWEALATSEVVLAPSRGESLGNTVIEAQLARRAVVATSIPGHRASITNEQNGLLVPVDDPLQMADAVQRLLDDPLLADRLTRTAVETARAQFGTDRYAREVVDLTRSVTNPRRPAGGPSG